MHPHQFYHQYLALPYYANLLYFPCLPIRVIKSKENVFSQAAGNVTEPTVKKQNLVKLQHQIENTVKKRNKRKSYLQRIQEAQIERQKKDKDFRIRNQKSTRNIHSNTLKYFTKYVKGFQKSPSLLQRLIQGVYGNQYSVHKFYEDLLESFSGCKYYIKLNKMKSVLTGSNEKFGKILRILLLRFFKSDKGNYFQFCKKLKKNVKKEHLKDCRVLLKQAFG